MIPALSAGVGQLFTPLRLFRAGEKGVWYDPSDMSSMFQDSAGTTAVTAVEQPVGKILDKSGNGNHATQSTSAARPVLSARYNLLTQTELFSGSDWSKVRVTATSTSATNDPLGGAAAQKIEASSTGTIQQCYQVGKTLALTPYVWSVYAKAAEQSWFALNSYDLTDRFTYFNLSTGAVGTVATGCTATITSVGNGWYRCTVTRTAANSSGGLSVELATADNSRGGVSSGGIYIWGAGLRVSNDGTGLPAYQRVNTSTDYDTTGFPYYLRFDGTDDSLATSAINFTATNKMSVFAGVRKMSDGAASIFCELSATASTNAGTFYISAPDATGANGNFAFKSRGSIDSTLISPGAFLAPTTRVLSGLGDIAGDVGTLRINGTAYRTTSAGTQGTGNYGNYAFYIGARGGSSLYFTGRLYGLIVRGASTTGGDIASAEQWLNSKARIY